VAFLFSHTQNETQYAKYISNVGNIVLGIKFNFASSPVKKHLITTGLVIWWGEVFYLTAYIISLQTNVSCAPSCRMKILFIK
jgi:hypothetical protein